jgi:L-histidine N-alpha-methyltransferase
VSLPAIANVRVHASQFPEAVRADLLQSLRTRKVNHKFHYDSVKQTQKWLALHNAYSPSRTDADCIAIYEQSFEVAADLVKASAVHLIGLGCGGGQKDTRVLRLLRNRGKSISYTPCDVSVAMVLVARATALSTIAVNDCFPFVCDLANADDLAEALRESRQTDARLVSFFGMIPNFEPQIILPRLAGLIQPDDLLLFSANLASGSDYVAGVQKILPLYDNQLTRDWLMTFLLDLGVESSDGGLRFGIEDDPDGSGLKRVVADFMFSRPRRVNVEDDAFEFTAGDSVRLFFSYRHTPERVVSMLSQYGLFVARQWISNSKEEGVFLCQKAQR